MTTLLLTRHCEVDALDHYLAGRAPGERLNATGRARRDRLASNFAGVTLDAVYSSPLERARDTAQALAPCAPEGVLYADALLEIDFGEWTGKTFAELHGDPRWIAFNAQRTTTRIPGGELMSEVQERVIGFIREVVGRYPEGFVALVSHGDVIRAALCHSLGLLLDRMHNFEISPGSVSVVRIAPIEGRVLAMNVLQFDPRTDLTLP